MNPVFIMSSERSGSNLLRVMLGAHSDLSAPPAAHIPTRLSPTLHYYGDLRKDDNLHRIVKDAISIIETHPVSWKRGFQAKSVIESVSDRSFWGVVATLYELEAAHQGKNCWVSKDNCIFDFAFAIKRALPAAKFLYLVRDGRDYTCSMRNVQHSGHVFNIAKQWRDEQRKCLQIFFALDEAVHIVRYEELVAQTEPTLKSICHFLGKPFEAGMIEYHEQASTKKMAETSEFWTNLRKPIMRSNYGKFMSELSSSEIRLFESIAGAELTMLGYSRVTDTPMGEPALPTQAWYQLNDLWIRYWQRRRTLNKEWRRRREQVIREMQKKIASQAAPLPGLTVIEYQEYEDR